MGQWPISLSQQTRSAFTDRSFSGFNTPAYVIDEELLVSNLKLLKQVRERIGAKILLAQKAYSCFATYPLIARYLSGTTASGLFEAKLAKEEFPDGEVHVYSAAYRPGEVEELAEFCDHIVFNSFEQWQRCLPILNDASIRRERPIEVGLRINPEYSEQEYSMYDPAASGSRLGIRHSEFVKGVEKYGLEGISFLHFHTLCEQGAEPLHNTLKVVEEKFGSYLKQLKALNLGGGHHLTRADYNLDLLAADVEHLKESYDLEIYLEPGEAVVLDCGYLVASVLDIVGSDEEIAILDTSATCHMPDVLEMPYRPRCFKLSYDLTDNTYPLAGEAGAYKHTYLFGGPTCLAGDVFNKYSFPEPLSIGDKVVFCDMALYSFVKNNTFNGMPLPALVLRKDDDTYQVIKAFDYQDFKMRLS